MLIYVCPCVNNIIKALQNLYKFGTQFLCRVHLLDKLRLDTYEFSTMHILHRKKVHNWEQYGAMLKIMKSVILGYPMTTTMWLLSLEHTHDIYFFLLSYSTLEIWCLVYGVMDWETQNDHFVMFLFGMRPPTSFRLRWIFVRINEFQFASNAPNFIGFGLNLDVMEFFKVIQHPKFHWVWTKPHDTLGDMSNKKTALTCTWKAMKIWKDLCYFMFKYLPLELGIGVLEVTSKILCKIGFKT